AVVHESAKKADSAIIGPFCVNGKTVVIGENTELKSHVTIGDNAVIGKNNRIFQYASIGEDPIDYTYKKGDFSQVVI
ncbi:acyl-[acyl-carrier-protein]--UDP-N-acetylglucosamine O-acyltransferase, partial [Francisella tularensis subsp. holarctica]|nr:acyl-[acyl-carrier-protein]--UDP-N-acetylglucosamine O-acyltransferase [Francisella tularensis subsp. holarctica]